MLEYKETREMENLHATRNKTLPSSDEVAKAAFNADLTLQLVQKYQLTAVELAQLIERLPTKAVPW